MKQVFVTTAFAIASAALVFGCASETTGPSSETGSVGVNLMVGDTDVKAVSFELVCDSGFALNGQFNVNDEQDPPIWAAIMDVPVPNPETGEPCSILLRASDDAGNVLCTGEQSFVVEVSVEPVKVDVVLLCGDEGDDPLGNIDIDATFEIIDGNNCPRLHFLNAVPDEVPAEGSEVTVWVSDKDGDTLTTELTATGGKFEQASSVLTNTADPVSVLTTYFCDGAAGARTISVTVTDGDAACGDKSKSFDVTCPGVDPCEGVVCEDDGNECTAAECVDGNCVTSNLEGTMCGGNVDVAMNGGLEEGSLNGWTTEFCDGTSPDSRGLCELSDMANTGNFAVRVFNDQPASSSVLKQANKFPVSPGDQVAISFAAKGATAAGGVVFAEFFSEIAGGGTSASEILGSLTLTNEYQFFNFNAVAAADVSGGITLQFAAVTGGDTASTSEVFVDDVSITVMGGEAGMCSGGQCVPAAECAVAADCPDTGNECIDPVCNAGTCGTSNNTNTCDGDAGTCNAGVCEPDEVCEYTQDFESLTPGDPPQGQPTSLADDGWLVGGNEFLSDGVTPDGSYFAFPAPNGGPAFSAVAVGEGGTPQGAQQMSIYNDYNNAKHGDGKIIEAVVFRERDLVAADVGTTISFTFDAKAGNIELASTAEAFIQVLNKLDQSFAVLVGDVQVTTDFSTETWVETLTVSVPIDGSLVGQLLQYGGRSRATLFQGSGIFYDNMSVCSAPTP